MDINIGISEKDRAPGTYKAFGRLTSIPEDEDIPAAKEMIRNLVRGHEQVATTARRLFPIAENASDQPTADLLTQRLETHEKAAWMLRSLLDEASA